MRRKGLHATPLVTKYFQPQPLPREPEDFPRHAKHFKHMTKLTFVSYFPLKGITRYVLFMCYGLQWDIILTSSWFLTSYIINSSIC